MSWRGLWGRDRLDPGYGNLWPAGPGDGDLMGDQALIRPGLRGDPEQEPGLTAANLARGQQVSRQIAGGGFLDHAVIDAGALGEELQGRDDGQRGDGQGGKHLDQ